MIRVVVRQPSFEKELKQLIPDFERADEFMAGAEWALARRATGGTQIRKDSPVWCIHDNPSSSLPPVVIYYSFNDAHVYLMSIKIVERNGD